MLHRLPIALAAAGLARARAPAAHAQGVTGNAEAGKQKNSMCTGCHGIPGYHTAYPEVYHVPKIGGQQPGYIISALKEYKSGARWHPSMRGIAASLSEQDMADLAAYYSGAPK
jgi:cytochrome c553